MNEELVKALKAELEAFKANLPQYASQEDLKKMGEIMEVKLKDSAMTKEVAELKSLLQGHGELLKKMEAVSIEGTVKSLHETIMGHAEGIIAVGKGKGDFTFTVSKNVVKAAGDTLRGSVTGSTQAMRLTDVGQLATISTVIAPLFRQGRVGANSNGVIRYVDQATATRGAAMTAEGTAKGVSAITWQEYTLPLQKIADSIPVSTEALADVDFISGEIQRLLEVNLALKEDEQVYKGSGTPPNLNGVYTSAVAYTAVASGITAANIYDLIVKMQESIASAADAKYRPNFAIMNHATINAMRLTKDLNHNYVLPPFVSANGDAVAGITIIASAEVAANTMLVGDFNYGTLFVLDDVTIKVGTVNAQFTSNMVTILAEKREALLVRTADLGAFKKCTDITAALATLAT
jgi:HK97 family phage major capsid protein